MGESMLSNQEETEQIAVDILQEALKDEAEPEAEVDILQEALKDEAEPEAESEKEEEE